MNYLEALSRRYSVKKFNHESIPQEALLNILESGKLSASSLGLQPYKILVVESEEMKQKLIPAFYNPSQISTCSHLIVIISKKTIEENYIRGYFKHISEVRETPLENLDLFKKSINQHISQKTQDEIFTWAEKQSYIVLANLMYAAAIENIDSCPMEGFRQELIEEILNINPETEKVTVTLALGYRSEEDHFQHMKKVRKPNEKLFKFI
ncbi:MAG: NAD(P)H-dependent oxidoreductase [Chryseobacterium sp.]|jgi:nitroreductase|uniref:NAD(P)H-dependent oxidoreductase n=1 Tax=Chryseobacterium sp. TaxID=1871047 RepID=UPI002829E3F5|nr:NAD(P)H-dependent oxidoreductase [Chryseobacterium sp.]MDR2236224.1 NAD(P)H-dependent oxidoreductase [Chryseobacterium sp.]